MPELSSTELDERLSELERDIGPALRTIYRTTAMRPGFAAELSSRLIVARSPGATPQGLLRLLGQRAWPALAAMLVGGLVVSAAVFVNRPRPVSANVLDKLQAEAMAGMAASADACTRHDSTHAAGVVAIAAPGGAASGSPSRGPVSITNTSATDLSDRLATVLGVSSERVREAMVATLRAHVDAMPPDPIASVAQQLGVSPAQVCEAFSDPQASGHEPRLVTHSTPDDRRPHHAVSLVVNGQQLDPSTVSADELALPAQRLGVSPERLAAALRAAVPSTPPPAPGEHEIVGGLARNLGMSEDKVRAALQEVEGNGPFTFVVPLPGLGR